MTELMNVYTARDSAKVAVTIHLVAQDGCILQQYLVKNLSDEEDASVFFEVNLRIELKSTAVCNMFGVEFGAPGATLNLDPTHLSVQLEEEGSSYQGKPRLNFALFENGDAVRLDYEKHNPYSCWLELRRGKTREWTAKYHLGALNSKNREPELDIQKYADVSAFLRNDKHGLWALNGPKDSAFVFRRYLEHILSVCAIPVKWEDGKAIAIAFSNGEMQRPLIDRRCSR
jgi:hypothetical protein